MFTYRKTSRMKYCASSKSSGVATMDFGGGLLDPLFLLTANSKMHFHQLSTLPALLNTFARFQRALQQKVCWALGSMS